MLINLRNDCIACLLRPILIMGCVTGQSPITIHCPHSDPPERTSRFKRSYKHLIISILLAIPLIIGTLYSLHELSIAEHGELDTLHDILDVLFFVFAVPSFMGVLKCNQKLNELNALAEIFSKKDFYGITEYLSYKTKKVLLGNLYIQIVVGILTTGTVMFHVFTHNMRYNMPVMIFVPEMIMAILIPYAHTAMIIQYFFTNCVYQALFRKCFQRIRYVMELQIVKLNAPKEAIGKNEISFEEKMIRLRCLYSALYKCFQQFSWCMMNPQLLITFTVATMLLITNIDFLLYSYLYTGNVYPDATLMFKCCGIIVKMMSSIIVGELINVVNEDILSFLFKYPISKLSAPEAAQVEMLLAALTLQKPILRASDIFTVGTRLLASISGTVVTYVLVALQFHASWSKNAKAEQALNTRRE